ncbi:LOW QUALITY PROTEIN: olfactory receptor 1030-like [Octodon degus]|uniref:LOW QUALITY PROTEIN: olfactory receptor 1030-like n=1 Tax=Octodon degus TaxID=10160 RepID=A0A6P3FFB2_OCTDE|nr:LOW QUALITY PROTEIN: olfactory receptor 1030-like [Octodon degus]
MPRQNYSMVTEFVLLGLTDRADLQPVLFAVFLLIYIVTIIGNLTMIFLIRTDSKLHTPMYFFLSHLAFVDLCYATNVTPQMLVNFLSKRKTISFVGCFIQFHLFIALVITDYYMLTVMAYDRYVAICQPLLYGSKMSRCVCVCLVAAPYLYGFANGLAQTILMLRLTFCGPNEINHFYCADPPLLVLACSDTYVKETMLKQNYSVVAEFILLGLTDRADLQPVLFAVFLLIYLITVIGNVTMISLIRTDSKLHTPMYFFLSHLAFVDLCYATTVAPQMLVNFLSKRKAISFVGCMLQFNFFIAFVITDYYVLALMAYDRYVAICQPLLYGSKMSRCVCVSLVAAPYLYGFANGLAQTILMLRLTFCGPNEINHFYCADPPLMVLACSDTYVKEMAMFVVAGSNLTCSLGIILVSYVFIFAAILRIRSAEGRRKAFSTCGSHLTAVTIFYGSLFCMHLRPPSETSVEQGKIIAVFYIFVYISLYLCKPMLNPLIYSLRNKDVKMALKKVIQKELFDK